MTDQGAADATPGGLSDTDDGTHEHLDPSAPPRKYSHEWWAARNEVGRCKAHRRNGDRCKRPNDPGAVVCGHHGARAPAVRRRARQRLEEATDRMAKELLKMATDEKTSEAVKLRAITEALDRGNLGAKTEIEISASPLQQIMESAATSMEVTSRSDWRRSQGRADDNPPALADLAALRPGGPDEIIGEVVDEGEYGARIAAQTNVNEDDQADTPDDYESQRDERAGHLRPPLRWPSDPEHDADRRDMDWVAGHAAPPVGDGYVTVVEGNEQLAATMAVAAEQRRADVLAARETGRAVVHRAMRALPPGRSDR